MNHDDGFVRATINKSQNHDHCMVMLPEEGITIPICSILLFFQFLPSPKTGHLLNIIFLLFIFDGCCYNWAVVTPVKYESHANSYFCKFENFLTGEINEWSLSNPHPSHPWSVHSLPMFLCSPVTMVSAFSTYWDCNMKRAAMRFCQNYV